MVALSFAFLFGVVLLSLLIAYTPAPVPVPVYHSDPVDSFVSADDYYGS